MIASPLDVAALEMLHLDLETLRVKCQFSTAESIVADLGTIYPATARHVSRAIALLSSRR